MKRALMPRQLLARVVDTNCCLARAEVVTASKQSQAVINIFFSLKGQSEVGAR